MKAVLCLAAMAALTGSVRAQSTLWISDDVNKRIYQTSLDGSEVFMSFHSGSISGLCVDPNDDTLWAAKEGSGLLMHYDRLGNTLDTIATASYDAAAGRPEGIAIDYFDDTMWAVDDETIIIYNLLKDGTLLDVFSTTVIDPGATSPQSIATDPVDGTLWITDNASDCIYNVKPNGELISSFLAATYGAKPGNPQGISVSDDDGTLWVTDRYTHTVYNITRDGALISSFDAADFGSSNPTGVAYDAVPGTTPTLTGFTVLALDRLGLRHDARIIGDVGLAPDAEQRFDDGFIDGDLVIDPTADNSNNHSVEISGQTYTEDLSSLADEITNAFETMAGLPADASYNAIWWTKTLTGGDGLNVFDVDRLYLWGNHTLTLSGTPTSEFVINIDRRFFMGGNSSIVLEGGVDPRNVFFNITGKRTTYLAGASEFQGTLLAGNGSRIRLLGDATLKGAAIGSRSISVRHDARIVGFGLGD